jgi:hypothetical protein
MSPSLIGKLDRVPLRELWKHEAKDFTQWLQENIDVLNNAIGLNLLNVDREREAGDFSIDLVAENEGGGTVIIENQLEKSDHDHLGKLITYLTGMNARAAICRPTFHSDRWSIRGNRGSGADEERNCRAIWYTQTLVDPVTGTRIKSLEIACPHFSGGVLVGWYEFRYQWAKSELHRNAGRMRSGTVH